MRTLPPYAAKYLGRYPDAEERFNLVAATAPSLEAEQRARLAGQNTARDSVQGLKAELATLTQENPRDAAAETRLQAKIKLAERAHLTAESATIAATRVSHGSRVALDKVAQLIEGRLAGENADLELVSPPKLPKGKPSIEIVAAQRAALEELDEEAEAIARALPPKAETLALAQGSLDAEVHRGRLRVTQRGRIVWPETPLPVLPIAGSDLVKVVDAVAIIAALNAEALGRAVEDAVEQMYVDVPADQQLTAQEKRRRLAALTEQRFEVEVLEVEAVFAAWAEGRTDVGLRPDVDPMAVLGIRTAKAGEARQGLGVSIVEAGKAFFGA